MTELKTLKDIEDCGDADFECRVPGHQHVAKEELRQEAINHLKTIREKKQEFFKDMKITKEEQAIQNKIGSPLESWIKHFFDIKNEDLQ